MRKVRIPKLRLHKPTGQGVVTLSGKDFYLGCYDSPEAPKVTTVEDARVEAVVTKLSPIVADMVRFQRATGARPGEVCNLKPSNVDRSGDMGSQRAVLAWLHPTASLGIVLCPWTCTLSSPSCNPMENHP